MEFHLDLKEMPLPSDWDAAIFDPKTPFAKRVRYAKERAPQVGKGSGRAAFIIPYEGRQTVLKIAINRKGAAQNEAEAQMLSDWYAKGLDILIPMIDHDEAEPPTWLHVEFAEKAKESHFQKACGGKLADLCQYASNYFDRRRFFGGNPDAINEESELAQNFVNLIGTYDTMVEIGDLTRLANWGVFKGQPVIIDIGLSSEVYQQHYAYKPPPSRHPW